ncbi:MAG: hypothetical protein ACI9SD_001883 [Pseudohongiellaceae bacterium]
MSETITKYKELKKNDFEDMYVNEDVLNPIGYDLIRINVVKEAIKIFKLHVAAYPDSQNPYDRLGEAYMLLGQKACLFLIIRNRLN